jgi:O-antigen/teichoic acid export membrane protein
MSPEPVRIAKNTTYLTAAYIIQKILSFLYFILIARLIGVGDIGKYIFALSFTTIFGIFIDFGFSSVLTREAAKDITKTKDYLNNILGIKVILSVITYLAVIIGINLLGKELLVRQLVYLSGLVMVFDSFYLSFYAALRARQNLKYEAIGMSLGQVIIVGVGTLVLLFHLSLHWLVGAILAGSLFNFIYAAILMKIKLGIELRLSYNREVLKPLFIIALPFAIAGIFSRVYGYIDTVLLSTLAGDKAVGWYSAGYKITFALQFIPMAMSAALFPAMSNYFVTDRQQLAKVFEKSMYYLMLFSLPITFGVWTLAAQFIGLVYGQEFIPTALALQILIFSLVFNFLSFPVGALLNACNRQTTATINMGITMIVNVILNIILIPWFGEKAYLGAAIAALGGSATLFFSGFYWADKIVSYNKKFLIKGFFKILLACVSMSLIILVLKPLINFLIIIPIGGLIFFIVLYLARGIEWHDVKDLYFSFAKRNSK